MDDEAVFLVTELWVVPNTFSQLREYRKKVNDILEIYEPEYVFHNHAFEWVSGGEGENYPTGIEVTKFKNEVRAREAIAALDDAALKSEQSRVFSRVRCYLSRYAFPDELAKEIYNQARN